MMMSDCSKRLDCGHVAAVICGSPAAGYLVQGYTMHYPCTTQLHTIPNILPLPMLHRICPTAVLLLIPQLFPLPGHPGTLR
jgi:hypothetical protein